MGPSRRTVLALAVLLAVLATPAGALAGRGATGPPAREAAVADLLDRRAAALVGGDREAFLRTVDPQAPAAFREAQASAFDGWQQVPVARLELEVRPDSVGDLSRGLAARYGGEVWLPETVRRWRFEEVDDRDVVETLWTTYVRRDGAWYVAGDADLDHLGLLGARTLWELGPVAVTRTENVLAVSRPDDAARAAELADLTETALARLAASWPRPWSGTIALVLPGSVDELERVLRSTFDLTNFVAFVSYETVRDEGWTATAPRLYVQDRNLSRHGRDFQVETLVHELVHAATAHRAGPAVDLWVHEGLADWVAVGAAAGGRPSGSDGRLPRPHEFRVGGRSAIVVSYREARSAMATLAAGWGPEAPVRLFETLGAARVAPGSRRHRVSEALRDVTGLGLDAFEARWAGRAAG